MADQLVVRTGEMARRQEEGPNRKIFGAMARYLPALSGMRLQHDWRPFSTLQG
jgi:hypothetical protein